MTSSTVSTGNDGSIESKPQSPCTFTKGVLPTELWTLPALCIACPPLDAASVFYDGPSNQISLTSNSKGKTMRYVYTLGGAFAAVLYVSGDLLQSPMNQIRALFVVSFLAAVAAIESFSKK